MPTQAIAVSPSCLFGQPNRAGCKNKGSGKSLNVPLPRRGQRFVKIVDVEKDVTFGRCEPPEVHQVAVTARLNVDSAVSRRAEVCCHNSSRSPIEREGRLKHARISYRNEIPNPVCIRGE